MIIDRNLRVRGVALPSVDDYREAVPAGKWSQFYGALSRQVDVTGITQPALSRTEHWLNLARSIRPSRDRWMAESGFNLRQVGRLNARVNADLRRRAGEYDLIVQLQTLCLPRAAGVTAPYVVYTDNTMALTQRLHPAYAPLSPSTASAWQAFEAGVCHAAEAVFTFSEFARRSVIDDYGCPSDDVVAIGAGANQWLTSLDDRAAQGRRVLFVGNQFERKGGDVLLRAWPQVVRRLPDAELILVGPKRDPAPGFGHGVSWRGRVDRAELERLYRTSAAFVLPSLFEPWGHVFVEAMGFGLPCIGTDSCAMPELIEDRVSGRLVIPGDPTDLAHALIEVLADPESAARMGQAGYERVKREMTWDHVVQRLLQHLRR